MPLPPDAYLQMLAAEFRKHTPNAADGMIETLRRQFEPDTEQYKQGHDLSLRYFRPSDVTDWAEFIRLILPRAIEAMESWSLPEPGTAQPPRSG
jgi:hypothetical protein